MEKDKIGLDAGTIWHKIDSKGAMSVTELKKLTKLDFRQIYLALGWLARENKVYFYYTKEELYVSLIYH
ncbi:MAG TPA: winged helix-turn-helix domain-containing protein [Bacteroidales bacterium]|nr:winged helix-turn-helix domain-containing protein [Bacteroidales bacterium]